MKCSKRSIAIVPVLFALLLSLCAGTLNARDADLTSIKLAAAHSAAMREYVSCALSRLPVLEANPVLRVSGHLSGLHPLHL